MLDMDEEEDNKKRCTFCTEDCRISIEKVLERLASKADSGMDRTDPKAY
jgi:hypothetical protein